MPTILTNVVMVQRDVFDRIGTNLGANWRETGTALFHTDGDVASPDTNVVIPPGVAPNHRGVYNAFDPKDSVPAPNAQGSVALHLKYSITITMPTPLPSNGDFEAGLVVLGKDSASDLSGYEFVYDINGAGAHRVFLRRMNAAGTVVQTFPIHTPINALTAGDSATLTIELIANNLAMFELHRRYQKTGSNLEAYGQATIPGDITQLDGYGGIVLSQLSPITGSAAGPIPTPIPGVGTLDDIVTMDVYNVTDGRNVVLEEFHPMPAPAATVTRSSVSMQDENVSSGQTLTLDPSYAMQISHQTLRNEISTDGGYLHTWPKTDSKRRLWNFVWAGLTSAERTTLRTLFDAVAADSFAWSDPETGEALTLRFLSELQVQQVGQAWHAQSVVEEVL